MYKLAGIFISYAIAFSAANPANDTNRTDGSSTNQLKFLTIVDGKAYFADRTSAGVKNWTAAGDYCRSAGMKLAEINSNNQWNALLAAYHPNDFYGSFWTAGRDAQIIRQFSWNNTNTELSSEYTLAGWNLAYQTCLFYQSVSANQSHLLFDRCTASAYTLCET